MLWSYRQERRAKKESPEGRRLAQSPKLRQGLKTSESCLQEGLSWSQEQRKGARQTAPRVNLKISVGTISQSFLNFIKETIMVLGKEGSVGGIEAPALFLGYSIPWCFGLQPIPHQPQYGCFCQSKAPCQPIRCSLPDTRILSERMQRMETVGTPFFLGAAS